MPYVLRDYRPADFDVLWRLDQECFASGIAYSRFELMAYIRRRGAFTLIAEHGDAGKGIAGFVVAERGSKGAGHVITIDVHPSAQRTGIGTRLMETAETRLREAGCNAILLETAVNNLPAIAFYKRHGYDVLRTLRGYYNGELDALVLGKRLQ